jgi:hypothetical protein
MDMDLMGESELPQMVIRVLPPTTESVLRLVIFHPNIALDYQ